MPPKKAVKTDETKHAARKSQKPKKAVDEGATESPAGRQKMTKWQVAQVWRAYQSREGPQNLGTVEWPKPKKGCLKGLKMLSTGVFETIERDDLISLLTGCGAHYYSGMSPHLHYLLVGRDAGPAKLRDAEDKNITQLSEAEFFTWIKEKIDNYVPSAEDGVDDEKPMKKAIKGKAAPKKQPAKARKAPAKRTPLKGPLDYDSDETSGSDEYESEPEEDDAEDEAMSGEEEVPAPKKTKKTNSAKASASKRSTKAGPVSGRGKKAVVKQESNGADGSEKVVQSKKKGTAVKKEKAEADAVASDEPEVDKGKPESNGLAVKRKRGRPAKHAK